MPQGTEPDIYPRFGAGHPATMGRVLMWYDGPVCFEVDCPKLGPYITAQLVPDRIGWTDTAVAIHLSSEALEYAKMHLADMRMLMTRPNASLWRVDFLSHEDLTLSPILDPCLMKCCLMQASSCQT